MTDHGRNAADAAFDERIASFGLTSVHAALRVRSGEQLRLSDGIGSPVRAQVLSTENLFEFRDWIGHEPAPALLARFDESLRPSGPWSGRAVSRLEELTAAEREDVEKAMRVFLFGDCASVASYERVLQACYAPFRVAAYAIRHLVIEPQGSLIVTGLPAVLLAAQIDIHDGGTLHLDTITSAVIGRMQKLTA